MRPKLSLFAFSVSLDREKFFLYAGPEAGDHDSGHEGGRGKHIKGG
jgi:hypothetical protein